jgi:hypothetical protein
MISMLMYMSLLPFAWIFYSAFFFYFIIKYAETVKTIYYIKSYSVLLISIAVEALARNIIFVREFWGNLDAFLTSFFVVSISILCFCFYMYKKKNDNIITSNICICFALILATMITALSSDSLIFGATYQIISAWGCVAIALYVLSQYIIQVEEMTIQEKKRIIKNMMLFCALLALWVHCLDLSNRKEHVSLLNTTYYKSFAAVAKYRRFNSEAISKFLPTETVDITDRLDISLSDVRVVMKNNEYFLKYNVRNCYRKRGLPSLGFGAYFGMTFEDYKKGLALSNVNHNSPDLNSPYDGIGDVYFEYIYELSI